MAIGLPKQDPSEDLSDFYMALPVTRHVLIPEEENFEFLISGVDSLDLGPYVHWKPERFGKLLSVFQDLKEKAQAAKGFLDRMPDGRSFLHLPTGKPPNYRYCLKYADYQLYLGITNPPASAPNVYLSLNSKALWHKGIMPPIEMLSNDLEQLGGRISKIQPSRVDLCADFYLPGDLSLEFIKKHMVSRSRSISHYAKGDHLETFYAGAPGSPIRLRIYDKGKEIIKSGKPWFLKLWGKETPVGIWRVEFQLQRSALKEWGIESLDDLTEKLGGLWNYLTTDWFSLRFSDNDKQERRTVLPWWKAVQEKPEGFGSLRKLIKPEKSTELQSLDWYLTHIGGCLPSYAAKRGAKDLTEALNTLQGDLCLYWFEKDFQGELTKRQLRLGNDHHMEEDDYELPKLHLFGEQLSLSIG